MSASDTVAKRWAMSTKPSPEALKAAARHFGAVMHDDAAPMRRMSQIIDETFAPLRAQNKALRTVIESAIAAYDEASDLPMGAVAMRAILSRGLGKVG